MPKTPMSDQEMQDKLLRMQYQHERQHQWRNVFVAVALLAFIAFVIYAYLMLR